MSFLPQNEVPDAVRKAEETLRLMACVPVPDGLVDRVQASVRTAPLRGGVLSWPRRNAWMYSPALRGAAAAAIVCVVAGGGWGIYSHVQFASPTAKVQVLPAIPGPHSGFSSADAIRKPDTLNGPVLAAPVTAGGGGGQKKVRAASSSVKPGTPHQKKSASSSPCYDCSAK